MFETGALILAVPATSSANEGVGLLIPILPTVSIVNLSKAEVYIRTELFDCNDIKSIQLFELFSAVKRINPPLFIPAPQISFIDRSPITDAYSGGIDDPEFIILEISFILGFSSKSVVAALLINIVPLKSTCGIKPFGSAVTELKFLLILTGPFKFARPSTEKCP